MKLVGSHLRHTRSALFVVNQILMNSRRDLLNRHPRVLALIVFLAKEPAIGKHRRGEDVNNIVNTWKVAHLSRLSGQCR